MTGCTNPKCNAPEVSCYAGEMRLQDCPDWNGAVAEGDPRATVKDGETRLPWSGAALGTTDLPFLTARSEPKLIALVGPHNAGKTTLLGSWYQLIGRTGRVGDALFAGSYSLEGWEAVAHALRWDVGVPGFPPHTPSGAGRRPGLLHLALRHGDRIPADHLFADAPGEWFHRWGVDASAADAEGARWLGERASAFLVVADCEALSGDARGEARASLVRLIRRVGAVRGNRPVALVWAKADLPVAPGMRDAIVSAMGLNAPDFAEFHTSVVNSVSQERPCDAARSLLDLLDWSVAQTKRGFTVSRVPIEADDPFFLSGAAT